MKRAVFILLCITLVACQTTSGYFGSTFNRQVDPTEIPVYRGSVENIIAPIIVRYRPYPQSRSNKRTEIRFSENGKESSGGSTIQGFIRSEPQGGNVLVVLEVEKIEEYSDRKNKTLNKRMMIKLLITKFGEVLDISFFMSDTNAGSLRKIEDDKDIGVLVKLMAALWLRLPKEGITSGQILNSGGFEVPGLGDDFNISMTSTVRGVTKYKNRNAVVIDLVGSITMEVGEMALRGYGLLDTYTGAWIYSDVLSSMYFEDKGSTGKLFQREVGDIQLASGIPIGPTIGEIQPTPPPRPISPASNVPSSEGTSSRPYSHLSDRALCGTAINVPPEPLDWDHHSSFTQQVQEAKRRRLTVERCAQLTGRKTQVVKTTMPPVPVSPPSPTPTQSTPRTAPQHLVMAVQKRLADLGYDPGPADGVVGSKTRSAIKAYQNLASLDVTGEVSADLLQRLKQETAAIAKPTPTVQPPPTPAPAQTTLIPDGIDFGRYHALVIGNNAYSSLPRLKTAVNDAKGVANLLREAYGFNVTVLTDATRDDTIKTLYGIRSRLKERDSLLIYYAGHGSLDEKADRGYWFPVDATEDNPSRWLSNATITDTLKAVSARHVLVVADSCYSGAMARAFKRGALVKPRTPGFIAQMLDKKSRTVLASGGMEPVVDSGGGGHSVFAKALLDALSDNKGVVDGTQVFAKVREQVRLNAHQTPQYSNIRFAGHEVGGDFLFVRRR